MKNQNFIPPMAEPTQCTPTCYGHSEHPALWISEFKEDESENLFSAHSTQHKPGIPPGQTAAEKIYKISAFLMMTTETGRTEQRKVPEPTCTLGTWTLDV
jgi:hypothetical protein